MTSRRSFLACVMGAAAASALPKAETRQAEALRRFDATWAKVQRVCHPYMICESLVIQPGETIQERLFPPPVPNDFRIDAFAVGLGFVGAISNESMDAVRQGVTFDLRNGASSLIAAPLAVVPQMWHLPLACQYRKGDDLGVYLRSDGPVKALEPVSVHVVLFGSRDRLEREAVKWFHRRGKSATSPTCKDSLLPSKNA